MKTLHLHLTRQTLATLTMTVAVFTAVLLLGNIIREVFTLLLNEQASPKTIGLAIALLIPYVLVFALPMGLLTAMLLTFGRLSADQELIAIRGGGISVVSLVSPVLLLAVGLSGACAFVNMYLAPQCRTVYKDLLFELSHQRPSTVLTEGRFIKDIQGYILYVGKIKDEEMHDVLISVLDDQGEPTVNLRAARGRLIQQPEANSYLLRLFEASGTALEKGQWHPMPYAGEWEYPLVIPAQRKRQPKLNEMTFFQLREELKNVEEVLRLGGPGHPPTVEDAAEPGESWREPFRKIISPLRVQMHHQAAFSFACLGFTLVGIPLGIRSHRKETSIGIAISLVLILVFYSFFIMAQALETRSQYHPHLLCWIPNFLFQGIGGLLLWRANRT